ncbi:MAG TPA: Gfo/Idh/MocA family oxidoreductase [Chthonomonas sp.]|uniref:Gfo/Idh/MocA family protein n=1 Tax=Chthonomonas sp. TaxID=2282153 RepID=UPI002B4AC825|nr:Gfo/Idh/MocA family oxidoreductase [Chthonomonas sp.]HLI47136.1 Gfo/Idh/MocA family oxidoreductase [Chthonomonas sp.]
MYTLFNRYQETRRKFLTRALAAIAAAGLPTWYEKEAIASERALDAERPRRLGPNDTIQFGLIGCGGKKGGFRQGLNDAHAAASKAGCKVVAVCDVDRTHCADAANEFGPGTKQYHDFRDLLADKTIDAVIIGTPDHWHVQIAIAALRAGKDVYCEKPLTLTIDEGKKLVRVAQETGRVFQVGSQQRSDPRFRLACEIARNGLIGKIKTVTAHLPTGPTGGPFQPQPVPDDLDFDFWLGPAPSDPTILRGDVPDDIIFNFWRSPVAQSDLLPDYFPERVYGNFRWWLDYSGGMMTDWGAHHNDIAQWGLGTDHTGPIKVQGFGRGPTIGVNCYNTFPEFDIYSTYADGTVLHTTNQGENGVTFEGENGTVFVSRSRIEASDPKLLTTPLPPNAIRLYVSNDHMQNFVDCIRTRKETICPASVGHRSATICHLGNISLRLGGKILYWDPERETFHNDPVAEAMLSRPRRKPWLL